MEVDKITVQDAPSVLKTTIVNDINNTETESSSILITAKRKNDNEIDDLIGHENESLIPRKIPKLLSSGDATRTLEGGFSELIKVFYQWVFPAQEIYKWLSYGNVQRNYFPNREISYAYENDIVVRHLSYADPAEFRADLIKNNPAKIDIGPVYNMKPKDKKTVQGKVFVALERELVFDIDMTDYDDIRICCKGANICHKCWDFITISIKIIDHVIREDFGFKHRLWVYSGRRGVHCWVCDERARKLCAESRTAIVKHIEVIKGGDQMLKKVNLGAGTLHPTLVPAMKVLEEFFPRTCLVNQDILGTQERWDKILKMLNDEELRKYLDDYWRKTPKLSSTERWGQLLNELEKRKTKTVVAFRRDIMFQYLYPRLDEKVSTGVNHLLKSPFCVHPKTGRVCVPIIPEKCEYFDPLTVPTLSTIVNEVNMLPQPANNNENNYGEFRKQVPPSFLPHLEHFRSFIKGMEEEIRTALRTKRIEEEKKLIF